MNIRKNNLLDAIDFNRIKTKPESCNVLGKNQNYINLIKNQKKDVFSEDLYNSEYSVEIYKNFLKWLLETFNISEKKFREDWIKYLDLKTGQKVLITSCGLGSDINSCIKLVGKDGMVHAQDLSSKFIEYCSDCYNDDNIGFSVSDALDLPYRDNYFDAVCHFGGINLFGDIRTAIQEMTRVCKVNGKILFGDESVAPHLRENKYGKMFIKNNKLWGHHLPLKYLPENSIDINIRYILGNCFYLIGFIKNSGLPKVNIDIEHVGHRGGSVRTRYFGELEGVNPELRKKIYDKAKQNKTSVSKMLENFLKEI